MKKKFISLLAAAGITMMALSACGQQAAPAAPAEEPKVEEPAAAEAPAEEPAAQEPAEAAPEEQPAEEPAEPAVDKAILVVSFGTSYDSSRDLTIGGVENAIAEAFPDWDVRRAFTAQIIIDKLKEEENLEIDNVTEALDRAVADGIKTLVVQPTHLMNGGLEYQDLAAELENYRDSFETLALGRPLLSFPDDYEAVAKAITAKTASYDDGKTAIVFMGHGTEAPSNATYARFQDVLTADGFENYYVGTVEATPSLDDVLKAIKPKKYEKVVLEPLMVVAGDHANNDMAGDEEDSWKSVMTKEGYEVECILEGLGQIPEVQQLYVQHAKMAVDVAEGTAPEVKNQAILVVSFGTSYDSSRDLTIGGVENAIAEAFPEYDVRRAFTAQIIIDKLKEEENLEIDNVEEALQRAVNDGVATLIVQPTHLMNGGLEHQDLLKTMDEYSRYFNTLVCGDPLLTDDADYDAVAEAITTKTASYDDGETAIVFMGHGTEAKSNSTYAKMQDVLTKAGFENYFVGTVEAKPSLDDVLKAIKKNKNYKKVVLEPLMVVAGDHANNDMAGDEEDSWKSVITNAGYEVECILEGLGQVPEVQELYVAHTMAAIDAIGAEEEAAE